MFKKPIRLNVYWLEDDQVPLVDLGIDIKFDYDGKTKERFFLQIDNFYQAIEDQRCTGIISGGESFLAKISYNALAVLVKESL